MYDQPFFITTPVSNNAFNYEKRANKQLYVPRLINGSIEDVRIGTQTVFEDFDDDGKLHSCIGLENFVHTKIDGCKAVANGAVAQQLLTGAPASAGQAPGKAGSCKKPAYIFDNHNHAFAFWCNERQRGNLQNGALLIHIDQHKDTRTPASFISKQDAQDPQKVFQYTNTVLNVGNFIPAAQHIGLVNEIIFIDSQMSLQKMAEQLDTTSHIPPPLYSIPPAPGGSNISTPNLILDIDLDFFAPDSDYIGNELKLEVIRKLIPRAKVITFATSPYFIDQNLAISYLKRIAELAKNG